MIIKTHNKLILKLWEGEARREGIIKWSPLKGKLSPTIH